MPPSGEVNFPESSVAVVRTENCVDAHENVGAVEAKDQRPVYEMLASVSAIELSNRQQRGGASASAFCKAAPPACARR